MIDFLSSWHAEIFDPDRIPQILAAWLVCVVVGMITGPMLGNVHAFVWIAADKVFGGFGDRLDRKGRARGDLMFRGFLLAAFALLLALVAGKAYEAFVPVDLYWGIWPILFLATLMSAGSVFFSLLRLYFAMEQDDVKPGAYLAISRSARQDLTKSDEFGITRAAIGLSAKAFDKGLIAPALWYVIGGFPFALIYAVLGALSWRFGKSGYHSGFASVVMALERLMGFIPSLFAALLLNLAAFITPTAKIGKSLASWLGHKGRAPYEEGGMPLSALAWALNITLGGPSQDISGSAIKASWTGPDGASAKVDHGHLRRALYIQVVAHLLFIASFLGAYVWAGILGA